MFIANLVTNLYIYIYIYIYILSQAYGCMPLLNKLNTFFSWKYFIFETKSNILTLHYCIFFLCRSHTPKHPSVTLWRRGRLFSFIRTRPLRYYSESLSFLNLKRLRFLNHVLTPSIHAAGIITNPDPHTVIFHCVICFLRSNPPRGVLPSQPTFHTVQAAFAFTFPIVSMQ